jgi:hypothetical protein
MIDVAFWQRGSVRFYVLQTAGINGPDWDVTHSHVG